MKLSRSLFAIALMGVAFLMPAQEAVAQYSPGATVLSSPVQQRTYRATVIGLAPASSATDILTISGKSGGPVLLRSIKCSGISTAAATAILQVIKRSTLDTGGTSAAMTAVRLNAKQPAAGATLKSYTANPGALGTAIGTVDAGYLTTNTLASSAVNNTGIVFDFTNQNLWIDAATTQVALNANAQSFSSGASLACTVEWSE